MSTTSGGKHSELVSGPANLHDAIDRWGPDLGQWPDLMLVRRAREALLADRSFRAYRDQAVANAARLRRAAAALDKRIADSGSLERITRKLLQTTGANVVHWRRRIAALAAVVVVSAGLGSAFADLVPEFTGAPTVEVVQLDTLVFGPSEVDF